MIDLDRVGEQLSGVTIQKGLLEAPVTSKNIDIQLSLKHSLLTEGNFKWENASAVIFLNTFV